VKVEALDHINIITADLHGTARFYADLLGLDRRPGPAPLTRDNAQWMYADDRAILHINSLDCPRTFDREVETGPTGSIHHVALRCTGYGEMIDRLAARGLGYQANEVTAIGLRQLFVQDPNGVLLELNFFAD
jgi:catechol 2,3-dioxygenase-like lactoylglutathione lyase family enzyme